MAAKKVLTTVKINLPAGEASPAPPLGPALGQYGVAIMDFVRAYNERTSEMKGEIVPAAITIYEDRTFDFEIKKAPVSEMIKKKIKIEKGSGTTPRDIVGTLSASQAEEIAKEKMEDFNTEDLDAAKKIVAGTAKSMGVKVED
jgi:large subunit ribosomal protein L11